MAGSSTAATGTAAATTHAMPAREHSTAPKFNENEPRELRRYFAELDTLFDDNGITDDADKKKHACRYLDVNTAECWETVPEFRTGHTYADFVTKIYTLYPGSGDE
jgi:hypothetical protein